MDLRKQLLAAFEVEHRDHLDAIRRALQAAESGRPVDLKEVFRRAHTLKGAARAVDLPVIEDLAHRLEAVFSRMMEGGLALDRQALRAVHLGLDEIEAVAAALTTEGATVTPTAAEALDRLLGAEAPAAPAPAQQPAAAPAEAEPEAPVEYLRVPASQIDRLSRLVHELSRALQDHDGLAGDLRGLSADLRPFAQRREVAAIARGMSRLVQRQRHALWSVDQAQRRLRDEIDRIRMVPARAIFDDFGRQVRELARSQNVDVDVALAGLDVQADRQVLQALKDPVLHLGRNAVSHGAEPALQRAQRGKPPALQIGLGFATRSGRLEVTVWDDGRGPDFARIEAVARERGLLEPGASALSSDQLLSVVFEPGFSTAEAVDRLSGRGVGLSIVAEAARQLHGAVMLRPRRPWGTEILLSVPLTAARQLLLLVEAGGQTFTLPTFAVERLLRLPVATLDSIEGRPVTRIAIAGRDVVVPVVGLTSLIGSATTQIATAGGILKAALLRRGDRHCAVAVDVFRDVRSMVVGERPPIGVDPELVIGSVLLEDETPALVLNPEALVERWMRQETSLAGGGLGLADWRTEAGAGMATILIVDDSITTRTLQKSILEAQGYRVLLSVDGLDALERLRGSDEIVDLVVADVEMPRMDGFTLLQTIRNDPRFESLPVILMTSRDSPEDVRRGMDLGASGYITKQKFDQRELLSAIGQLL